MKRYFALLMIIMGVALAVRLTHLTYHSLWFDEAMSVYWARQTVPRILEVGFTLVEDRLPPLYYLMLKGWIALLGSGEAPIRGLSVAFGLLLVPVLAAIAALLLGRRVALFAAGLIALNPFLVWYAQEARMYAPAAFFGSLTVWSFLKVVQEHSSGWGTSEHFPRPRSYSRRVIGFSLLFILAAAAGLYSHLYTGFLLPALGLWLLIAYPRHRPLWVLFAGAGLVIILLFSPIALAIWRFSAEAPAGTPLVGLAGRAWGLLHAFTVWKAPLPTLGQWLIPLGIALFALLAFLPTPQSLRRAECIPHASANSRSSNTFRHPRLLVALLLLMPFIIANLLLFRNQLAFFGERYFIIMVPWLLLLAALGSFNLGQIVQDKWQTASGKASLPARAAPITFYILLLTLSAIPLPGQWTVPAAKEAWRQSVAYLAKHATAADAILIHPDWVRHPFQYYFQGPGQTYAAFSTITEETALDGPLQGVIGDHPVIWLIQSHLEAPDPERRVEGWLAARYPLVTELYPPGISLKGYAPGYQLETLPPETVPVEYTFENGLQLVGYQADRHTTATDALFHPPSGWIHITLYWAATQPITSPISPFVHLVGPEGVWGISLERSSDALKLYPPERWEQGIIIRHDLDVNLNPATPPGHYQLVVGLSGHETQYPLGQVEVR